MLILLKQCLQAVVLGSFLIVGASAGAAESVAPADDGLVKVRSAYPMDETVARLRTEIVAQGARLFESVDQSRLAADAGITQRPSTLLVFGNIALGAQFLTSNPYSGLDWPVRMLVVQDEAGTVWVAYTDFAWIARRYRISDRKAQFAKATQVVESISAAVRTR